MIQDSGHHFRHHVLQMSISKQKEHAFFIFLFLLIYFNWIYLYLLYNIVGFAIHWHESVTGVHVSHLPSHPIPLGCRSAPALSALFHASSLDWSSVSHMVIYMFQCYCLKSSHPHFTILSTGLLNSIRYSVIYFPFLQICYSILHFSIFNIK